MPFLCLYYAELILEAECGDPLVVKAAAILHDIGILEAERKHGSSAGKYQEIEGVLIAREILLQYNLDEGVIEHICKIIGNHHSGGDIDSLEFCIIWDTDHLVNISAEIESIDKEKLWQLINKTFKTSRGKQIAIETFIKI